MIEDILRPLVPERFLSDERYRRGHIRVINPLPGTSVLGLHIPDMRKAAASLSASPGAESLIAEFEAAPDRSLHYEEYMVWGMMLNLMKLPSDARLEHFRRFIPHIDNWAVCDSIASGACWAADDDRTWSFIMPYFQSDKEFEVRFALIIYMARMMNEENLPDIFDIMQKLDLTGIRSEYRQGKTDRNSDCLCQGLAAGRPPYYVRMGMAWLMATALARYPDRTRKLLSSSSLPDDVLKLYVRKARESFRTRNISPF